MPLSELKLIQSFAKILDSHDRTVLCGIGDDAAILKFGKQKLLVTTDALLENVHFRWDWTDAFQLGRKALSVNLSDIAAMGGKPRWAVVSIAIPQQENPSRIKRFYQGLKACAEEFQVSIVGGDTDQSLSGWKISLTLIGEVFNPVLRSAARVGDSIWVTGNPGYSALGLELLKQGKKKNNESWIPFLEAHRNPVPRVQAGQVLAKQLKVTSMIDISDGLLLDLERICTASNVGAQIEVKDLLGSKEMRTHSQKLNRDPLEFILTGGEDYELLFTLPPRQEKKLMQAFKTLKIQVSCIGKIVSSHSGIQVFHQNKKIKSTHKKGYTHFS